MTNTIANATLASVSETNRSRIMQHLYQHGISSRAQIAKALDLTPAAITKITAKLIEVGAIKETGDFEGRKNRRSIGLTLDTAEFHVIAVKFARSLVQLGVFDLAGKPLTVQELPQVTEDTIDSAIMQLHDTIGSLIEADRRIIAIGMAVPGPYLRNVGRTAVVSSMRGWQKVNFIHEFSNAFTVPVFVEQDARAGAMAQYLFDPTITTENLAYYLVGEGVGLGVIDHGNIINGALGAATEIGHVSIDINGKPCDCGNVGCLERYCSTPAIHEMILKEDDLIADAGTMTHLQACRALFALARGGDKRAIALIKRVARYVGFGCITIFNHRHHPVRPARGRCPERRRGRSHQPVPRPPVTVLRTVVTARGTSRISGVPTTEDPAATQQHNNHGNHPGKETIMTKPIVLSLGELLWDMLPSGKRAGGAPVNFAYHAKMNGADGWSISAVGEDALGDELLAEAEKAGIHSIIQRNAWPTSTVEVSLKNGIPEYTIVKGVAWDHLLLTRQLIEVVEQADAICYGTLALRSPETHDTIIELLKHTKPGAMKFFDINLRGDHYSKELIEELLEAATVFKINDAELLLLRDMFDIRGPSDDDACRWFMSEYGLDYVILTGGSTFSTIISKNGESSTLATPHVEVVDTVGAGDSFSGTFTARTLLGDTLAEAHRKAVNTAAYVCTANGAWPEYPDTMPDYLAQAAQ